MSRHRGAAAFALAALLLAPGGWAARAAPAPPAPGPVAGGADASAGTADDPLDAARRLLEEGARGEARPYAEAAASAPAGSAMATLALALVGFDPESAELGEVRELARLTSEAEQQDIADTLVGLGWRDVGLAHLYRGRRGDGYAAVRQAYELLTLASAPADLRREIAAAGAAAASGLGWNYDAADMYFRAAELTPMFDPEADGQELSRNWLEMAVQAEAYQARHQSTTEGRAPIGKLRLPQDVVEPACAPVWVKQREARLPGRVRQVAGAVLVETGISLEGRPSGMQVVHSFPPSEIYEERAIQAVEDWRADPETVGPCQGVSYIAIIRYYED